MREAGSIAMRKKKRCNNSRWEKKKGGEASAQPNGAEAVPGEWGAGA